MNWLTEFSRDLRDTSDEDLLREAIEDLTPEQQLHLGYDTSLLERPSQADDMDVKIASAVENGKQLAIQHGDRLEKEAIAQLIGPAVAGLGRLAAGAGAKSAIKSFAGSAAKDFAMGKATNAVAGGLQGINRSIQPAAGGFKYANVASSLANFGRKAVGFTAHNPGVAVGAAGALAGAALAPRDPQTGEKQYAKGALIGGGIGLGANALSAGRLGNKLHGAVAGERAILGNKVKNFVNNAQTSSPQFAPGYTPSASLPVANSQSRAVAPAQPPVIVNPKYNKQVTRQQIKADQLRNRNTGGGGLVSQKGILGGNTELSVPGGTAVSGGFTTKEALARLIKTAALHKMANRQTLTYDPQTKSFMRRHLTPDTSQGSSGSDVIPAGTVESAGRALPEPPRGPVPVGLGPSPGPSQVYSSHGGDVLSSSPGRGIAARPQVSARPSAIPPPIPAAAKRSLPRAMPSMMASKSSFPSLAGAVSLARR